MPQRIYGVSSAIETLKKLILRVGKSDSRVLILGENGTGKELVAQALHDVSARRDKPFVAVNCAAVPEALMESELFGHEKGAFTGATSSRPGRFEEAEDGTLFLDEVGELPLGIQAKLLRALAPKTGSFSRIGGQKQIPVRCRVICATNRDLARAVAEKTFRADLYHRLAVMPIKTPPLRHRVEDIEILTRSFLDSTTVGAELRLTSGAVARLQEHKWPGNVRELMNVVERIVTLAEGPGEVTALDVDRALTLDQVYEPLDHIEREPMAQLVDLFAEYLKTITSRPLPPPPPQVEKSVDFAQGELVSDLDGTLGVVETAFGAEVTVLLVDGTTRLPIAPYTRETWQRSCVRKYRCS